MYVDKKRLLGSCLINYVRSPFVCENNVETMIVFRDNVPTVSHLLELMLLLLLDHNAPVAETIQFVPQRPVLPQAVSSAVDRAAAAAAHVERCLASGRCTASRAVRLYQPLQLQGVPPTGPVQSLRQ